MAFTRSWKPTIAAGLVAACLGAAPMPPSYIGIEQTIDRVLEPWGRPGARPHPNAAGWRAFFDALRAELRGYATAADEGARLRSLDRVYRMSVALGAVRWRPASEIREELRAWLRPRVRLAWAERRLIDTVRGAPPASAAAAQGNRDRWVRFVDEDLGSALRAYEEATTSAQRREALKRIRSALAALQTGNRSRPWAPSLALQTALNDLFNRPNLDLTADLATLSPALNTNIVDPGPIFFKGQWSYVTPGPKTGFGLMHSDEGITFYNSQMMTSVTPIAGFQQQVAQDRQGRRAAKIYHFDTTSQNNAQLTITAMLRPDGLRLWPSYLHNIGATVSSTPIPGFGKGVTRLIAGLIGFNQNRITRQVWEGAIGRIRQEVVQGAAELGSIRSNEEAAKRNAVLRRYLVGNNTLAYNKLQITGLSLRSRPQYALVGGTILWRGGPEQGGADMPQPSKFQTFQPGVAADVHLPSVMSNLVGGYLKDGPVAGYDNVLIVTRNPGPGARPADAIAATPNADFATFSRAVEEARAANDPKELAVRVKKPGQAPEFAADARGNLVALVRDFTIEVPAPPQAARGGGLTGPPARIYRLVAPQAEFTISFKITPPAGAAPARFTGRIEGFDPGPGATVFAINEDEANPPALTAFTGTIVLRVFGTRLQGQPIDVSLDNLNLGNFALRSVSPLDPTGWMRVVLAPLSGRRLAAEVSPTPTAVRVAGSR